MFLNLRRRQIYILDVFDFCDLCKFVCVYVFVVIKDANFTVIKSVTLAGIKTLSIISSQRTKEIDRDPKLLRNARALENRSV